MEFSKAGELTSFQRIGSRDLVGKLVLERQWREQQRKCAKLRHVDRGNPGRLLCRPKKVPLPALAADEPIQEQRSHFVGLKADAKHMILMNAFWQLVILPAPT